MDNLKRQRIAEALADIVRTARACGPERRIALMVGGGELGAEELLRGARMAQEARPGLRVLAIATRPAPPLSTRPLPKAVSTGPWLCTIPSPSA